MTRVTVGLIYERGNGTDIARLYEISVGDYSIRTLVTASPSRAGSWLGAYTRDRQDREVGLDVEWRPNTEPNMQNPVATLQLCVDHRCLVFQILHAPSIPRALTSFLANPNNIFVGVGIQDYVHKLLRDHNLRVANFSDMGPLARDILHLRKPGLTNVAKEVLDLDYKKPHHITMSPWDSPFLTDEQLAGIGHAEVVVVGVGGEAVVHYADSRSASKAARRFRQPLLSSCRVRGLAFGVSHVIMGAKEKLNRHRNGLVTLPFEKKNSCNN
ncbi:hypothetical protein VNO78_16645 [Psophocarpus tetragonolobus]|uniref:3'-5' exonuclease domain-containing protein n=1 Tax=Psophocarpus tetragonolobus TaxID=3891 RepID=A0AAN9SMK1_PSOTE